jgi:hypothetical protein
VVSGQQGIYFGRSEVRVRIFRPTTNSAFFCFFPCVSSSLHSAKLRRSSRAPPPLRLTVNRRHSLSSLAVGLHSSKTTVHQQLSAWIVKMKEQDWFALLDSQYFESSACSNWAAIQAKQAKKLQPLHFSGPMVILLCLGLGAIAIFHFVTEPFQSREMYHAIRACLNIFETMDGELDEVVRMAYKALDIHQTGDVPTEYVKEMVLAPSSKTYHEKAYDGHQDAQGGLRARRTSLFWHVRHKFLKKPLTVRLQVVS